MVAIPQNQKQTILEIDKVVEDSQECSFREHLGGSLIGDSCSRKLWYEFRWCTLKAFPGRIFRLFETGKLYEERFIDLLQKVGVIVYSTDDNGKQFRYELFNGHFGGELDSVLLGLAEAPKTHHVAEYKTHSNKYFIKLQKDGVAKSQPRHYAQMQMYMGMSGLKRAFYLAVNKDTDALYSERIKFDKEFYEKLTTKAEQVIFSPEPLSGITTDPTWYECKFCDHARICHYGDLPEVNCRTCCHVTPSADGGWRCDALDKTLNKSDQLAACERHLFIPAFMPWAEVVNYDQEHERPEWIEYKHTDKDVNFINRSALLSAAPHEENYTSVELQRMNRDLIGDVVIQAVRTTFGE